MEGASLRSVRRGGVCGGERRVPVWGLKGGGSVCGGE